MEQQQEHLNSEVFEASLAENTEVAPPLTNRRAVRFYDRMRANIRRYLEKKGKLASRTGELLMLAPDVFVLLWRLVNDRRVHSKEKVLLGTGLAYYLFPLDVIPEGLVGPLGYLDDVIFAVFLLNKILSDTDPQVLREHWSGSQDVLEMIAKVLNSADKLASSDLVGRFKK